MILSSKYSVSIFGNIISFQMGQSRCQGRKVKKKNVRRMPIIKNKKEKNELFNKTSMSPDHHHNIYFAVNTINEKNMLIIRFSIFSSHKCIEHM